MVRFESSWPRQRGRFCGFSLLELVIVLILVGVLAVFAMPRLTATNSFTVTATANRLIASIRYAQSLAMSQGQRYRLNLTANSYQITDTSGVAIVQPVTSSTAAISVSPVTLSGFNPPLTSNYLVFDSRGTPYVGSTVALTSAATITLTAGSNTSSISIAPETGRIK